MGPENFYRVAGLLLEHDDSPETRERLTAAADALAQLSAIPRANIPAMTLHVAAMDTDVVGAALVLAVVTLGLAPGVFPDLS